MIIPKITVKSKVSAETNSDGAPLYVLTIFIDAIRGYDTVEGVYKGVFTELPLELFLYKKFNNIPLTSSLSEALRSGAYSRIMDPDDINELNYTLFGSEDLTWGTKGDIRSSDQGSTLMPSVLASGSAIALETCDEAMAPMLSGTSTGYYKSRAYIATSLSMEDLISNKSIMLASIDAFVEKYIASISTGTLSGDLYETEDITS